LRGYILLGLSAAAIILISLVAVVPSVDDFSPDNPLWNGLSSFCGQFNASLIPGSSAQLPELPADDALIIVGPSGNISASDALKLRRFLEKGGLLIIADDFGSGNSILELMGISTKISGELLEDDIYMFRSPFLPRARVNRSLELYLNYASVVEPDGKGSCLAYSSPFSYLDLNLSGKREEGEPYGPFCVAYAEPVGSGRLVVLSDASIFINSMLSYGNNSAFLRDLLQGRKVYVLGGLWSESTYTVARSAVLSFLGFVYGSSLRYLSIPLTGIFIYAATLSVVRGIRRFFERRKGGRYGK